MNLGELKSQKLFFNPQTQLNQDWFDKKGEKSSFDAVLKSKKNEFSERGPKEKSTNVTMDRQAKVGFKQEAKVEFGPERSEGNTLKKLIKEGVAQNKFQKENIQRSEVKPKEEIKSSKSTVEEELEALEIALKEALGIETDEPTLEKMSEILGISLEELTIAFKGLTGEEVNTEPMVKVLESLTTETVMKFIESAKVLMGKQPVELQQQFSQVLEPLLKELPDKEVKMALEALTLVQSKENINIEMTQKVFEKTIPTEVIEVKGKESSQTEVSNQIQKVVVETEQAEKNTKVQEKTQVEKSEVPLEQKSMVSEVVKTTTTSQNVSFEEQVNLMKSEAAMISSAKSEATVPLAKHVMNQVVQGTKMSIQMTDQGSEMLIKLNPKNLGNVALKMAFDKGTLIAEIQVENQTVKGIIESNLDQLRSALKESGYNIGNLDVSVNKENTGQDQQSFEQTFKKEVTESFEEEQEKVLAFNKANNQEIDYFA